MQQAGQADKEITYVVVCYLVLAFLPVSRFFFDEVDDVLDVSPVELVHLFLYFVQVVCVFFLNLRFQVVVLQSAQRTSDLCLFSQASLKPWIMPTSSSGEVSKRVSDSGVTSTFSSWSTSCSSWTF